MEGTVFVFINPESCHGLLVFFSSCRSLDDYGGRTWKMLLRLAGSSSNSSAA